MTDLLERPEAPVYTFATETRGRSPETRARRAERDRRRRAQIRQQEILQQLAAGLDPRDKWRGPHTRVHRWALYQALNGGIVDLVNARERMVVALRLAGRHNRKTGKPLTWPEIAEILGVKPGSLMNYRVEQRRLAEYRTRRRLADAYWRAYHKHGWRG